MYFLSFFKNKFVFEAVKNEQDEAREENSMEFTKRKRLRVATAQQSIAMFITGSSRGL